MSRNKRSRIDSISASREEDTIESNENEPVKPFFDVLPQATTKANLLVHATDKEIEKFNKSVAEDARELCIKALVRLFIMKGGRKEAINKTKIQEVLEKLDSSYKKHANAILMSVSKELSDIFGYTLITGSDISGLADGKKEDFFLISSCPSKRVRYLLAQSDKCGAYFAFMTVVLFSILTAPGEKKDCRGILTNVRLIDPRFPVDLVASKSTGNSSLAIPELGDDFLGLIGRMKREQYVVSEKDKVDVSDVAKQVYSFGPRFHAEIGRMQLSLAYFTLLGQPIDTNLMEAIEREEKRINGELHVAEN